MKLIPKSLKGTNTVKWYNPETGKWGSSSSNIKNEKEITSYIKKLGLIPYNEMEYDYDTKEWHPKISKTLKPVKIVAKNPIIKKDEKGREYDLEGRDAILNAAESYRYRAYPSMSTYYNTNWFKNHKLNEATIGYDTKDGGYATKQAPLVDKEVYQLLLKEYPGLQGALLRRGWTPAQFSQYAMSGGFENDLRHDENLRTMTREFKSDLKKKDDKFFNDVQQRTGWEPLMYTMWGAAALPGLLVASPMLFGPETASTLGTGFKTLWNTGKIVGPKVLNAVKPGGPFWTNPLVKQMLVGTIASEGVNLGTNLVTGAAHNIAPNTFQHAEDFSDLVGQSIEGTTGWNPNSTWWGSLLTDMANPGWYRNPEKFIANANKVTNGIEKVHHAATNNKYWYRLRRPFKDHSGYDGRVLTLNYVPMMERISEKTSTGKIKDYLLSKGYTIEDDGYMRDLNGRVVYLKEPVLDESFSVKKAGIVKLNQNLEYRPILFTSHTGDVIKGIQATQLFGEVPKINLSAKANKDIIWTPFSDRVPIKRSSDWSPSNLKYTTTVNTNDIEVPLYNNPEFNAALAEEVKHVEQLTGYPVVGSSRLISQGYFGGTPGDVEIVVPRRALPEVLSRLKFEESRTTAGNTGLAGNSPHVLRGRDPENIDINIVGDDGTILHQLYETLNPLEIERLYTTHALTQGNSLHPENVTPSIKLKLPKTAELIVDEMNLNPQYTTQTVVDNAFKSSKPKHNLRKLAILTLDDPKIIKSATQAIDNMYAQINGFEKFSVRYPSLKFNNPEENKEILKSINWRYGDIDKIALNELMMKNIVDDWYIKKVEATRSADYQRMKGGETFKNILNAKRQYGGGSASGGGGNSILGSDKGGYLYNYTSYGVYHPLVDNPSTAKFSDVLAAMNREHEIWDNPELLNNAIKKVLHMPQFQKIAGEDIISTNDFTSQITNLVNKGLLTHEEANNFISLVAKELKVSGYRSGHSYNTLGNEYFGIMRNPDAVAYRNIKSSDGYAANPAEFGQGALVRSGNIRTYPVTKLVSRFDPALKMSEEELKTAMTHRDLVHKAEATKIKAYNDATARSNKRDELLNRYYNNRLKWGNIGKKLSLAASVFSPAYGIYRGVMTSNSKYDRRVNKFYEDHQAEIDKIVEKEIGKEPLYDRKHPEVWDEWAEKQDAIITREYFKSLL